MIARLTNEQTGVTKDIKVGFSWTTFFFGIFPALIRGQWPDAAIIFFGGLLTGGILTLIWAFFINKRYCQYLIEKGYKPSTQQDADIFKNKAYI